MSERAKEIRKNPELYELYVHNCNQVAQDILSAGGKDFAVKGFDFIDTMPNNVRNNLLNNILRTEMYNDLHIANPSDLYRDYGGWKFGKISELYKYVFRCE